MADRQRNSLKLSNSLERKQPTCVGFGFQRLPVVSGLLLSWFWSWFSGELHVTTANILENAGRTHRVSPSLSLFLLHTRTRTPVTPKPSNIAGIMESAAWVGVHKEFIFRTFKRFWEAIIAVREHVHLPAECFIYKLIWKCHYYFHFLLLVF